MSLPFFPLFTIQPDGDNRFAYDIPTSTVYLPDIFSMERYFEEKDDYQIDFESDKWDWIIFGINHEYLHFILNRLFDSDISIGMDFLKEKLFL